MKYLEQSNPKRVRQDAGCQGLEGEETIVWCNNGFRGVIKGHVLMVWS